MERMSDVPPEPAPSDLAALADGSLPAERRAEVEARVAASPELQEILERQRQAIHATQALATDEPSTALRAAVEAKRRSPRRRLPAPRFAFVGAVAAIAAAVAAVVLSSGPGAPSVADAARLAAEPPTLPAPAPLGTAGTRLALGVQGVSFPDFARTYGWRAVGVRRGRIEGRDATVVYYAKSGRRLRYVIVAGAGLSPPRGGTTQIRRAVGYQVLRLDGLRAVTWRRGGHTCVLAGDASGAELVKLASWPLSSPR